MPDINMDSLVELYDPHSGEPFHGAAATLPRPFKLLIDELADQTMTLKEAVERLEKIGVGYIKVDFKLCTILLQSHPDSEFTNRKRTAPIHFWRLLRFLAN
ncbi:MAG: hypothetical protein V1738_02220 [Patescibacteria group bacterium]